MFSKNYKTPFSLSCENAYLYMGAHMIYIYDFTMQMHLDDSKKTPQ